MEERLNYLIQYLLDEQNREEKIPEDLEDKKKLFTALCNIRDPKPVDDKFLKEEKEYLKALLKEKEIKNIDDINTFNKEFPENHFKNAKKMALWQGDITRLNTDAIVDAGNRRGLGCFIPNHNCIDSVIHNGAGVMLRIECFEEMKKINYKIETGKNILTKAYNLPCKYVITTVGPEIAPRQDVTLKIEEDLANCYRYAIFTAIKNGIRTIAFPCISTGVFNFPKDLASKIALRTIDHVLDEFQDKIDKVIFNVYSDEDYFIYTNNIITME